MVNKESEWQTRKRRIDTRLRALGWKIMPHKQGMDTSRLDAIALEEYPTDNGPADYALFVRGQFLGIIEAASSRLGVDPARVIINIERFGNTTAATIPDARLITESTLRRRVSGGSGSRRCRRRLAAFRTATTGHRRCVAQRHSKF